MMSVEKQIGIFKANELIKLPDTFEDRSNWCKDKNVADKMTAVLALGNQNENNGWDKNRVHENIVILENVLLQEKDNNVLKIVNDSLKKLYGATMICDSIN